MGSLGDGEKPCSKAQGNTCAPFRARECSGLFSAQRRCLTVACPPFPRRRGVSLSSGALRAGAPSERPRPILAPARRPLRVRPRHPGEAEESGDAQHQPGQAHPPGRLSSIRTYPSNIIIIIITKVFSLLFLSTMSSDPLCIRIRMLCIRAGLQGGPGKAGLMSLSVHPFPHFLLFL